MSSRRNDKSGALAVTAILGMLFIATSCSSVKQTYTEVLEQAKKSSKDSAEEQTVIGPTKVVTDASALALELPQEDVQLRGKFEQHFISLLEEGRTTAADILVARHPEHAYEILVSQQPANQETLSALASSYDRYCQTDNHWRAVIAARNSKAVQDYYALRSQWMGAVSSGRFDETRRIDLVDLATKTNFQPLLVDAWYQTGIGHLLLSKNAKADEAFATCAKIAGNGSQMQAAKALLLCSESRRRHGDFSGATTAWHESVLTASRLLAARGISGPSYWIRASYLQPIGTPWPTEVSTNFQKFVDLGPSALRTDLLKQLAMVHSSSEPVLAACWIESAVGSWHHQRGETHKSLIRLKKAESVASGAAAEWLRMAQSRELVALGQTGAATSVLSQMIAKKDDSPVKFAAMAELGVIRLQNGAAQHGVRLLKRALDENSQFQWPGRASVEADYALGLLMIGDNAKGESRLSKAQRQFESEHDIELLAKSLWNELQYLKHSDAPATETDSVKQRLESLKL